MAALADAGYVQTSRTRNADDRQEFFNQANARMLPCLDSQANFVMVDAGGRADAVVAHFAANRILLPSARFRRSDKSIRVSIGRSSGNARILARVGPHVGPQDVDVS